MFVTKMPPSGQTLSQEGRQIPNADAQLLSAWTGGGPAALGASIPTKATIAQEGFFAERSWVSEIDRPHRQPLSPMGRMMHPSMIPGLKAATVNAVNRIEQIVKREARQSANAQRRADHRAMSEVERRKKMEEKRRKFAAMPPGLQKKFLAAFQAKHNRAPVWLSQPVFQIRKGSALMMAGGLAGPEDDLRAEALSLAGEVWTAIRKADQRWAALIEQAGKSIVGWDGSDAQMASMIKAKVESPLVSWSDPLLVVAKAALGDISATINAISSWLQEYTPFVDRVAPGEIDKIGAEFDKLVLKRNLLADALKMSAFASGLIVFGKEFAGRSVAFAKGVAEIAAAAGQSIHRAATTPSLVVAALVGLGLVLALRGRK